MCPEAKAGGPLFQSRLVFRSRLGLCAPWDPRPATFPLWLPWQEQVASRGSEGLICCYPVGLRGVG